MKPVARVAEQKDYSPVEIKEKVKRLIEQDNLSVKGKSVFLKPSFVYPARPPLCRAVNTQPEFVGAVAHALKDLGARRVWVGEDCLVGSSASGFMAMGVFPYMKGAAEPAFLREDRRVDVKVDDHIIQDSFPMPKSLMDADVFITLPKLKVNMHADVTLSVKNHIGLLLVKDRLPHHNYNLHKKIADLYRARVPDYIITDAISAGEGQGPMHAQSAPLNCIVAGANGPAVDAVAATMMGFDPKVIGHLKYLSEKGVGPIGLADIDVDGEDLVKEKTRHFVRPRTDFADCHHSMKFFVGTELACPEGCVGMVRGSLDRWAHVNRWKPLKGLNFIVGKPLAEEPRGLDKRKTLVIGDCAEQYKDLGTFIPGCPIHPMAMTYYFLRKGIHGKVATRMSDIALGQVMQTLGIKFV